MSRWTVLMLCGLSACSRTVSGPTPSPVSLTNPLDPARTPGQVCNAQGAPGGWRLDLTGDGFSPLPIDTFTGTPSLAMPTVSLAGPSALELPGSQVAFVDATHLVLEIPTSASTPSAVLAPGSYAVTVTNPTALAGTLAAGLTVVPPPTLSTATPQDPYSLTDPTVVAFGGTGFRTDAAPTITLSGAGLPSQSLTAVTVVSTTAVTAQVAANTPAGTYDVTLTNPEGCAAILPGGLVVSYARFGALSLQPRFGWQLRNQAITLFDVVSFPATEQPFTGAPQLFITAPLKGGSGPVDIPLRRVAFSSPGVVTAVVPDCSGATAMPISGDAAACAQGIQPGGPYPLKILDPAGVQGFIPANQGFFVLTDPPPQIQAVTPSSIDTGGTSDLKVTGSNFAADALVRVVFLAGANVRACTLPLVGSATRSPTELHASIPTSLPASACDETTPQGAQVAAGGGFTLSAGLFVIRVQDVGDPAFADYSGVSVTNPASKGGRGPALASTLATARADFALVEAQDDVGQRYLYALGGTDGAGLLASVEVSPLSLFGDLGGECSSSGCTFSTLDRTPLGVGTPLARAGLAVVARQQDTGYLYVLGGVTASGQLANVERAQVLKVADAPNLSPPDGSAAGSLAAGTWYYRVSAIRPASDPVNPGGETLASDEQPIAVGAGHQVALRWPCVPGATGYRVYRNASAADVSGSELLLASPAAAVSGCTAASSAAETFTDDGAATPAGQRPLPPGALGAWVTAGTLTVPRGNPAAKLYTAADGTERLFVGGGFCTGGTGCSSPGDLGSVEVATLSAGSLDASFGAMATFAPRKHFSFAIADAQAAPASFALFGPPTNADTSADAWLLAVGGDTGAGTLVQSSGTAVEVAKIQGSAGPLSPASFTVPVTSPSPAGTHGGWAEVVADRLFYAGNTGGTGFTARIGPACPTGAGNGPGPCTQATDFVQSGLSSSAFSYASGGSRYLAGETLFRAYLYVAGGFAGAALGTPTSTIERITY